MTYLAQRITQGRKKSYGMYAKAAPMAAAGRDLIHMELGSPHADTPLPVKQATVDALMAGNVHYSHFQGLPKLRAALAEKLRDRNGLDVEASDIGVRPLGWTDGLGQLTSPVGFSKREPWQDNALPASSLSVRSRTNICRARRCMGWRMQRLSVDCRRSSASAAR